MQTTTNYSFTIAEGSDSVNLLTQLYPNFTSLDGILLPIQNNGTTPATHTKAGTVHQLVRTTTGCAVLRFVATGNYNAGDTFTVDGASVTATSCNGQSLPAGAFVINQSVMAILNGAVLTVLAGGSSISDASDVIYNNAVSGLTATNVQDAIDEVYGDIPSSFSATNVTYNNAVSGLTATDVQTAIDEIALGGGGDAPHGVYELWVNPNPAASFTGGQTITITVEDASVYDEFVFISEPSYVSGYSAGIWREIETSKAGPSFVSEWLIDKYFDGTNYVDCRRQVTGLTASGTTITVTYGSGYKENTVNEACMVPMRILGLVHNS